MLGVVKFYWNQHMKFTHVPEIETLFSKQEKVEIIVIFPTAQLDQGKALVYKIRLCYFYGNIT